MDFLMSHVFLRIDIVFLVMLRIIGFFIAVPIFGGKHVPSYAKIGISFIMATIVLSAEGSPVVVYDNHIMGYGFLIIKEFMIGITIGFTVYLVFSTVFLAGQLIDFQVGFSMVSVMDPLSEMQVPITGNLYYFMISAILLAVNGHHTILRALFYSYRVLPIGQAVFTEQISRAYIDMVSAYFVIAFKIASPIIGAIFLIDLSLGILARTAPQMNIFVVGLPMKLLMGLLALIVIMPTFSTVADFLFHEMYKNIFTIIKGLIP